MTSDGEAGAIVIALHIEDAALADHVAALLAGVPGLRLTAADADADLVLLQPGLGSGEDAAVLTPREQEVLGLLVEGASNKVIARRLGISVHTAKFHVRALLDKLEASGRTDAVAQAIRLGVIQV